MEISHVLPENKRNKFDSPERRENLRTIELASASDKTVSEKVFDLHALVILGTLQSFKRKMTVKSLRAFIKRNVPSMFEDQTPDELLQGKLFFIEAIKCLANDGFIKLSNAQEFEDRKIVKYHATAEPKFKSGKFQL